MKVGEIAIQLGVDRNTIRNWCKRYAAHLSEGANPSTGSERLLTTRDVNVLTYIQSAVNDGVNHDEITVRLGEKTFNAHEIDIVVGESQDEPVQPPEAPQTPLETSLATTDSPAMLPMVLTSIEARLQSLERHRDAQIRDATREGEIRGATLALAIGGVVLFIIWSLLNGAP